MTTDNFQKSRAGHAESRWANCADVVIVGGGVIGLSITRELALRGVREVVLLERGELGKEASWAAGGILAPQVEADRADDFFKLACGSRDLYSNFTQSLQEQTGIDPELDRTGTLYVAFHERGANELRRRYDWQTRAGLRVEWLSGDEARLLEPGISANVRCALRFPDDVQVENRRLLEALIKANETMGVRMVSNCGVTRIRIEYESVSGIESANGFISAPTVVVAAGAWTSQIEPARVQVEPVRGQMLCFKPRPQLFRHVIYSPRGYLVPRRDGRLLAGSTNECVGFDKRVTEEGVNLMKSMASEIAPGLKSVPLVDSWAGFRPHAPDDLPVLGPDSDVEGLFYATGHYRNGILLAPITAKIMADNILKVSSSPLIESFSPGRFRRIAAN